MNFVHWRFAGKLLGTLLLLSGAAGALFAGFAFSRFGTFYQVSLLAGLALSLAFLAALWRLWRAPERSIFALVMVGLGGIWVCAPLACRFVQGILYRDYAAPIDGHAASVELVYEGYQSPFNHVFSLAEAIAAGFSELRVDGLAYTAHHELSYVRRNASGQRPRYRVIEKVITPPEKPWAGNWPERGDIEISVLDTQSGQVIGRWHGPTERGLRGPMAGKFVGTVLKPSMVQHAPVAYDDKGTIVGIEAGAGEFPRIERVPLHGCPAAYSVETGRGEMRSTELHTPGWNYGVLRGHTSVVCTAEGIFVSSFGGYYTRQGYTNNLVDVLQLSEDGITMAQVHATVPELDQRFRALLLVVERIERQGDRLVLRTLYYTAGQPATLRYIVDLALELAPASTSFRQ